ncbi:histone-lysine N-methyltransferase SETMAR [Trichonephila clavipes]|nr:histone-lysine N-methyltransferase SETMAR [Trichonephila clavipes]
MSCEQWYSTLKGNVHWFELASFLHHENARPHIARCILDISQQNNVVITQHPAYSPELTPRDFWLFPQLKKPLRGKRFASNKAYVKASEAVLKQFSQNGFLHVFKK